jgi:hypothetical protein
MLPLVTSLPVSPANSHSKSPWRRSQAFDIKGLAQVSLMDCVIFLNGCIKTDTTKGVKIQYHAARMISKQTEASWLKNVKHQGKHAYESCNYKQQKYDEMMRITIREKGNFLYLRQV